MNFKSIFDLKRLTFRKDRSTSFVEEAEYDRNVDFYYTNLVNSIILFSLTSDKLEKMAGLTFDPIFELESEIDFAFTSVCFDTIFRNGIIDNSLKYELLEFKKQTDDIPSEIWDWEFIDNDKTWIDIRQKANNLLEKLGVTTRTYNENYTTVYDSEGKIIKKGKNSH